MSRINSIILTAVSCLILAGCASTPPATFYTLSSMQTSDARPGNRPTDKPITISLGPISFPDFLDRPQVVTRTNPNTLKIADFHRWGGSLQNDFGRVMNENLSTLLSTERIFSYRQKHPFPIDYNVTLAVKQFEGSLGNMVTLKADWIVTDQKDKKTALAKKSLIRAKTSSKDYSALISAQSEAVLQLAREISSAINTLRTKESEAQ